MTKKPKLNASQQPNAEHILTGGCAPKASAKGLACKADPLCLVDALGAKALAVAAKVERAIAVFILLLEL
jgi:hypothetical protein